MRNTISQADAVAIALRELGGFGTLGQLYEKVFKVPGVVWATKTPHASIRRIVQVDKRFFRIRPGLWGLTEMRGDLPFAGRAVEKPQSSEGLEFTHSYYQGLLLQLGTIRQFDTFVPLQDKNKKFLTEPLRKLATVEKIYDFGYSHLVRQAATIDVIWFNDRKMPSRMFEVERSTDIQNSLVKFSELQDFHSEFFIVADDKREREFKSKIEKNTFASIQHRVKFLSFETLAQTYTKETELQALKKKW